MNLPYELKEKLSSLGEYQRQDIFVLQNIIKKEEEKLGWKTDV